MAVKKLPVLSELPEPPDRLVGDQERFDVLTFNSLKAQKKMVNEDLNKTLIPALNEFAVDVNASVDAAKASETSALASKNSAASSAVTATTKAGEAAASAKAAKTSETSALASKNAASSSATAAANAQKAAEAARDEAQDLANVGYASEEKVGLAKVDGKTTQADAGGMITVKDVAIGGDADDLASARGFFYHSYVPWYAGTSEDTYIISDFNEFTTPGVYHIRWREGTALDETPVTLNSPNAGNEPAWYDGILEVDVVSPCAYVSSYTRVQQKVTVTNNSGGAYGRTFIRVQSVYLNRDWYPWKLLLDNTLLGDGFRITNGIISVPEYDGATALTAGTSGLVPPATAGQQESFLTGGGEYKPALTKISDSVSLDDSTTAASATAVKTAYNLANGKAPGGYGLGEQDGKVENDANNALLGGFYDPGGSNVTKVNYYNPNMPLLVLPRGTWGTVQLQISSGKIAWREKNGGSSQFTEWALAQVGYADTAGVADKSNGLGGHSFIDAFPVGNLGWILGLDVANDQLRPFPPDKVSVGYANSAGSANMKVYAAWHSNAAAALPAGGTWIWIKYANYPDRYNYCNAGTAAGGTWIGDESGIGGNTSGVSICAFKIAA